MCARGRGTRVYPMAMHHTVVFQPSGPYCLPCGGKWNWQSTDTLKARDPGGTSSAVAAHVHGDSAGQVCVAAPHFGIEVQYPATGSDIPAVHGGAGGNDYLAVVRSSEGPWLRSKDWKWCWLDWEWCWSRATSA